MIFNEIYGAYYNTVAAIISDAVSGPVSDMDIKKSIERYAFGESIWTIPEAIRDERWQLLKADGTTPLKHKPTMPLSLLQKRWLKAVASDPRVKLFSDINLNSAFELDDVEPLFLPDDYIVFDRYGDGDDYADEKYIANFRIIMDAIKNVYPLEICVYNRKGEPATGLVLPEYLEYSERDDKFRLIGSGIRFGNTINLGRIISCRPYEGEFDISRFNSNPERTRSVIFELTDKRNALERVLLNFAYHKKTVEKLEDDRYKVTIWYDKDDEGDMVIRILSFGPMLKVTAPAHFIKLIKQKLTAQKSCEK